MDIPSAAAEQSTAISQGGDRETGMALIEEGKGLLAGGDNDAALLCFEAALVEFDGNRPKLEQKIAALKKTIGDATAESPTRTAVQEDSQISDESGNESTDELGRLKDWVRSLFSCVTQPTRQLIIDFCRLCRLHW
jgi:hypothetical protein